MLKLFSVGLMVFTLFKIMSAASEYQGIYSILRQKYSACKGRADLIPDPKTFTIC